MSKWKEYKLSEIYDFSSGLSKGKKDFGFGYPFLTYKDIFNNFFVPENLDSLVNSTEKERERCSIRKGDVFLTRTSENIEELGMSCVALQDYPNATFNGFAKRLRQKKDCNLVISPEYAGYYFRSSLFRKQVQALASLTTRASLNNEMLSTIKIYLPEYEEQKRIGEFLKVIDDKIRLNEETNKTLEEMAQAIFKRWFVDFEFPNENGEPYKSSGGKFVESELGMIPEGWKEGTLDNLVVISTTSVNPKENPETLYEHYSIPAFDEQKYPKFEYGREIKSNKYLVSPNSFLVSKLNPTTKRVWDPLCITENAISSTEFINYLPKDISYQSYLYCILNSERFSEHLIKHATGSTGSRQRVKPAETLTFNVILPDTETLKKFDNLIRPIREKLKINQINSAILKEVRDTLLPKLISGEIRVPDAEREVEECLQKSN